MVCTFSMRKAPERNQVSPCCNSMLFVAQRRFRSASTIELLRRVTRVADYPGTSRCDMMPVEPVRKEDVAIVLDVLP